MEWFSKVLYWLSTGLMIPVMVLLIIFFVRSLIMMGSLWGIYSIRKSINNKSDLETNNLNKDNLGEAIKELPNKCSLAKALKNIGGKNTSVPHMEQFIADFEQELQMDLDRVSSLAKLGPMLGLMGTLIPMGPALLGLAAGDIVTMAQNLQVAFSTTVIGLFIGGIGYFVKQVKQRWYTGDVNKLEFVAALFKES